MRETPRTHDPCMGSNLTPHMSKDSSLHCVVCIYVCVGGSRKEDKNGISKAGVTEEKLMTG